jgi:MSHA biogenesis protein MshQ
VVGGASATPVQTNTSPARIGSTGTCSYAQLSSGGAFAFPNLPTNTSNGAFTTVSFWMKWDGTDRAMPIGWRVYDLWFYSGYFGFNTGVTDIYGVASTPFLNTWRHVVAVFANGDVTQSKLYVDGVAQTMAQRVGTPSAAPAAGRPVMRSSLAGPLISCGSTTGLCRSPR